MSTKIPWTDPDGTPCCCARECVHTANFVDPLLWDPLTGGGFSQALQLPLTTAQYAMFTAGGHIAFEWNASAFTSGSKKIPPYGPGELELFGEFSVTHYRKVEATFLNNSCKQKGLVFTQTALTQTCSSSGYSTGINSEFYPYMELDYPCNSSNLMTARFSFYNTAGTTGGQLYPIGMYVQFDAFFGFVRTLQYGIEGFAPIFDLLLFASKSFGHTTASTPHSINLITPEGTLALPCTSLGGSTASMTFTTSAP